MKPGVFKRGRAEEWTSDRIAQLSAQDIKQFRADAERLNEPDLAALCSGVLKGKARPRAQAGSRQSRAPSTRARKLIARTKAVRGTWRMAAGPAHESGGVRKADGAVVMALWAEAVESAEGGCRYLLWATNRAGTRPWSDTPAGRERLEHCKRAIELGRAEGLLVYGNRLEGRLPEDKAAAIHGADAETVLQFEVEERDQEYWAVWAEGRGSRPRWRLSR